MSQGSILSRRCPRSLFLVTLDFVSLNADKIDNLTGFPSEIGRLIFDKAFTSDLFMSFHDSRILSKRRKIIDVFLRAYPDEILTSLNVTDSLLLINEYTEEFVAIIKHVTELDLSSCHLGSSHELFDNMCHFVNLKKLSLIKNDLDDLVIRKITLPVKQFHRGPINLEELYLGGNPDLTDKIVPWMMRLKKLRLLQLTATGLSEDGISQLQIICNMSKWVNSSISKIVTSGWAKQTIEELIETQKQKIMNKKRVIHSAASHRRMARLEKLIHTHRDDFSFIEEVILVRNTSPKVVDKVLQSSPKKKKPRLQSDIDWTVFDLYK